MKLCLDAMPLSFDYTRVSSSTQRQPARRYIHTLCRNNKIHSVEMHQRRHAAF